MGMVRWEHRELIEVRFDRADIVAVSTRMPRPGDLFGYLEPKPYTPGETNFHVVEASPRATPAAERAAIEAELRERYPL